MNARHRGRLVAAVMLLGVSGLAGCTDNEKPAPKDPLLSRSDVSPLEPSSVSRSDPRDYTGTQVWSCSDNDGFLLEDGWDIQVRDLRNTEDNWALFSAVLDDPDGDAASELPAIRARVAKCREDQAGLEDLDVAMDDSYAYRSVGKQGRVDTVRAYAAVGDHRLVQLTLLGLNDHDAPDMIRQLLEKAVQKAS
jgi:hypothetical protein